MTEGDRDQPLQNLVVDSQGDEQYLPTLAPHEDVTRGPAGESLSPTAAAGEMCATAQQPATVAPVCSEIRAVVVSAEALRDDHRFDALHEAISVAAEQTCRHTDVVAASLRDDIRAIAEGALSIQKRVSALETRHARDVTALDGRVMAIERQRRTRLR